MTKTYKSVIQSIKCFFSNYYPTIIAFLLSLILYHGWFKKGILIGGDFQYRPSDRFFDYFFSGTWDTSLYGGFYTVYTAYLSKLPIYLLAAILSIVFDYSIVQRVVWLLPFLIIGPIAVNFFLKQIDRHASKTVQFIVTLFFLINPTILERYYRAHVWMTLVYAISPLVLGLAIKWWRRLNLKTAFWTAFWCSICLSIEVRTALLTLFIVFLIGIYYLIKGRFLKLKRVILNYFYFIFILLLLCSYWLVPIVFTPPESFYAGDLMSESSIRGVGKYTGDFLHTLMFYPKGWDEFFIPIVTLIPMFIFLPLLEVGNRFNKLKFLGIYLLVFIFLFLGKGTYEPLGDLYVSFVENVPFFVGYRVSNKFLIAVAPFYCYLFGLGVSFAFKKIKSKYLILPQFFLILITILTFISDAFLIRGYFSKFESYDLVDSYITYKAETNMFFPIPKEDQYEQIWKRLNADNSTARSLWFPRVNRYRYASSTNPQLVASNNFLIQIEPELIDYFTNSNSGAFDPEQKDLGKVLALWNIKYIVIEDPLSLDWNYSSNLSYEKVLESMSSQNDLKRVSFCSKDTEVILNKMLVWGVNDDSKLEIMEDEVRMSSLSEESSFELNLNEPFSVENQVLEIELASSIKETLNLRICDENNNCQLEYARLYGEGKDQKITFVLHKNQFNSPIEKIFFEGLLDENEISLKKVLFFSKGVILFENKNEITDTFYLSEFLQPINPSEISKCNQVISEIVENKAGFISDSDISCLDLINLVDQNKLKWEVEDGCTFEQVSDEDFEYFYTCEKNDTNINIHFLEGQEESPVGEIYFNIKSEKKENLFIDVYDMQDNVYTSSVSISSSKPYLTKADIGIDKFSDIKRVVLRNFFYGNKVYLTSPLVIKENYDILDGKNSILPEMEIENRNNTAVSIHIRNAVAPYYLIMQENYSKYWELKVVTPNNALVSNPGNHFKVNGYANAWLIDKKGDYDIVLNFKPQNYFLVGSLVSFISAYIIPLIIYILPILRKDKKLYFP